MRIGMRKKGELPLEGKILMGKNTMMKKVLQQRADADPENALKQLQLERFGEMLKLNRGLIFTNGMCLLFFTESSSSDLLLLFLQQGHGVTVRLVLKQATSNR